MRRKSEEFRKSAKKYKRNFGHKEKNQRERLFDESRALKAESRNLEDYISESLIDGAQVIATTLTGANHSLIRKRVFKTIFIDEASQALEAACWIPIDRVQRVVMSSPGLSLAQRNLSPLIEKKFRSISFMPTADRCDFGVKYAGCV